MLELKRSVLNKMYQNFKKSLYFYVASYFRFFASIRLKIWKPIIIVITGSTGKTTLLHLIESQLGEKAKYSHDANSSFGIPFDILELHRKALLLYEWPVLFLLAPIRVFCKLPKQKLYVVEADCDRPQEGKFLSEFLRPDITLWTNVSKTHCMNFDGLVKAGMFQRVEDAIAHEFGFFAEKTKTILFIPNDDSLINSQLNRVKCEIKKVVADESSNNFLAKYLLPGKVALSVNMCLELVKYFGLKPDLNFSKFRLPPGRNSVFEGIKNTTLVDSSYNANLDSMTEIIEMFAKRDRKEKWIVLGDMIEQGRQEEEEHKKLADLIVGHNFQKVILMGPRVSKYTKPVLVGKNIDAMNFINPNEVLSYLENNIKGGETILFKGARFLEGVIEHLLKNKEDIKKLARREKVWQIRREKWGL